MALLLRRPPYSVVAPNSIGLRSAVEYRCFSLTSQRWERPKGKQDPLGLKPQQPTRRKERSIRVASKLNGRVFGDLGLLAGTFIFPTIANKPSLFKEPGALGKLYWTRLKRKGLDLIQMAIYWWSTRTYKPRPKIRFMKTAPTAEGLHRQMYSAFAEGDSTTLKNICSDGLLENFQARIQGRGREKLKWELIKYNKRSRVMSNRCASLGIEGIMLRQAVVRISSQQRLTRFRPDGSIVPGTGETKDVQEYVVIQKKVDQGKEDSWVVWGTTEETTLKSIKEEEMGELE